MFEILCQSKSLSPGFKLAVILLCGTIVRNIVGVVKPELTKLLREILYQLAQGL